ncbi:MAG: hypothetical protein PWR03_298 [Tenuifilum sp.]|nr:hypothetical protein [Tenuifilum sp.]
MALNHYVANPDCSQIYNWLIPRLCKLKVGVALHSGRFIGLQKMVTFMQTNNNYHEQSSAYWCR